MVLQLDNFVVKAIFLDFNNNITERILKANYDEFTSNNSATVLGLDNQKYKIMFNNISIPENTKYITFQISLLNNKKYYNPYLFLPIKNENISDSMEAPGRVVAFKLHNNVFNYIWFYLTIESIETILNEFPSTDEIIDSSTYMKEYVLNNNFVTF